MDKEGMEKLPVLGFLGDIPVITGTDLLGVHLI